MAFMQATPTPLSKKFINAFGRETEEAVGKKLSVNPVVSEVAGIYEKIRSAMEYQEEEVVFRSAIERILRRRLLFESKGETLSWHLVRELAWAKYFPDNTISEDVVEKVSAKIDLYLEIYKQVRKSSQINNEALRSWLIQIMSADIAFVIKPNRDAEIISDLMFHVMEEKIKISDEKNEENKNASIFINIKRALAHYDKAFLRYELFVQYFGPLSKQNLENVVEGFAKGYKKIEETFKYPLNDRIYSYIKKQAVPFLILKDTFAKREDIENLIEERERLAVRVTSVCNMHYKEVGKKVRRAIFRSVIFILITKVIFAIVVEGSFEKYFFGEIMWGSLALNTSMPPIILLLVMLFLKKPSKENTMRVLENIRSILFEQQINQIEEKSFTLNYKRDGSLYITFVSLWLLAIILGVWGVTSILNILGINLFSQAIFVFFMVIVSFMAFRINQLAKAYNVADEKDNFRSVFFNFLFMPFIQLGRKLTLTFSKVNVFLIIFDFVIETPFKTVFAFLEHWFTFLRSERERME